MNNYYRLSMLCMDKYLSNPPLIREAREDYQPCFVPIRIGYRDANLERTPYAIATPLHCSPGVFRVVIVWDNEGFFSANNSRNTGKERHLDAQNTPRPTRWTGDASFWPTVTSMNGELLRVWLQTTIETGSCPSLHARQMGWQPDALISLFSSPLSLPSREKIPRGVHTILP